MKKLLVILVIILFCGCSAHPSRVSKKNARKLANKITYVQDKKTGLCYAVASSRIYVFGIIPKEQQGLGLTQVPCESCRHLLQE